MAHSLDTLLASEKPDVVKRAQAKAEGILLKIHLAEVRMLLQKTQNDMAAAMGVTQPTIASMEKLGKDLKLSSVKRYVEGAGAKVSLDIELPDGTRHAIPL
jgi:DNA-binding XRE family transcriptional regulator